MLDCDVKCAVAETKTSEISHNVLKFSGKRTHVIRRKKSRYTEKWSNDAKMSSSQIRGVKILQENKCGNLLKVYSEPFHFIYFDFHAAIVSINMEFIVFDRHIVNFIMSVWRLSLLSVLMSGCIRTLCCCRILFIWFHTNGSRELIIAIKTCWNHGSRSSSISLKFMSIRSNGVAS